MNDEEPNELKQIVPSILGEAVGELRAWLQDRAFFELYAAAVRKRIEVLVAELELLRSELDTKPMPTNPRPRLGAYCDGCGRDYSHCRCPAGESMARAA